MYYQQALTRSTVKSSVSLGGYVPNSLVLLRFEQEADKRRTFCFKANLSHHGWAYASKEL